MVIRNTGHDLLEKSTGAGSVGLGCGCTTRSRSRFFPIVPANYVGLAASKGAGVQAFEVQAEASWHGLVVMTGNCPSVGLVGGYARGGGHGQLESRFGLAADQALEREVVTATGNVLVASSTQNSDLYWVLSGGSSGTYGVVLSMTTRAYLECQDCIRKLNLLSYRGLPFTAAVDKFVSLLPAIGEAVGVSIWRITSTMFSMTPTSIFGGTVEQFHSLFFPLVKFLNKSGIQWGIQAQKSDGLVEADNRAHIISSHGVSYVYDGYQTMTSPPNITDELLGDRFIPCSLVDEDRSASSIHSAPSWLNQAFSSPAYPQRFPGRHV